MAEHGPFGIIAMELYIPKLYIDQSDFEKEKAIPTGKITKGLGQDEMVFNSELEDVNSMALTVLKNLMTRTGVKGYEIGKLEFATETLHDKSKSSKTVLMTLLTGNNNVEGVTNINACYGGTAALFNCLSWLQTDARGKLAVVVMSDVAVYDTLSAKPTGGAGAIALLLGPNPTVTVSPVRSSFFADEYDFYKPHMESEYPIVNGHYSIKLYINVLTRTYEALKKRYFEETGKQLSLSEVDYLCFHCPFTRQVEKGFLQLFYNEMLAGEYVPSNSREFSNFLQERPKFDEPLTQRYLRDMLAVEMTDKLMPGFTLNKRVGNIYTGSLYLSLMSLAFAKEDAELRNKRVLMYSYGAGVSASVFEVRFSQSVQKQSFLGLESLTRLFVDRRRVSIDQFDELNYRREAVYNSTHLSNVPSEEFLRMDTYYLRSVNAEGRRTYNLFQETEARLASLSSSGQPSNSTKFRKMDLSARIGYLNQETGANIKNEYQDGGINFKTADLMIENCIGALKMPLGIAFGFVINSKKRIIPMVTEEPSVIAAASNAAKLICENSDGFKSISSKNVIRGQLFVEKVLIPSAFIDTIESQRDHLMYFVNSGVCRSIVEKGGGVLDIKVSPRPNSVFAIDVFVDVQNAMGANTVNSVLEALKPKVTELAVCQILMAIVSNLSPERIIKAFFEIPSDCLSEPGLPGREVARKVVLATEVAKHDLFRTTTHNKGIMNGIDAVAMAVGQDVRAIEASCHAYSVYKEGRYSPLTKYMLLREGSVLRGEIEIPFLLGTAGGVTRSNKLYQLNLKLLGNPDARELGNVIACVGLAQNFAALRKLVTEGIQKGHMRLHARNIAVGLGMDPDQVPQAVEFMVKQGRVSYESAKEYLSKK